MSEHRQASNQTALAENTSKAYAADWRHFSRWCRLNGIATLPASSENVARYLAELATPQTRSRPVRATSIERRLSGLVWNYAQREQMLDRNDIVLSEAIRAIRAKDSRVPRSKSPINPEEIRAMVGTLSFDLRGLRDRALLLTAYLAGLGRREIVGLDLGGRSSTDGIGHVAILEGGAVLTFASKNKTFEVEIARGTNEQSCPIHALEQWIHFAKIQSGPLFVAVSRDGKRALGTRLNDKHVVRLIKSCVLSASLRPEMSEKDRLALFSGQSLRNGFAHAARVDPKLLRVETAPTSAQEEHFGEDHKDRFLINLTKASGF